MKKTALTAFALTLALGLGLTGCTGGPGAGGSAATPAPTPVAGTDATTRTFTVGFDAEFPPYGYQNESGEYVGFDLDLAQEVCTRNGWTLVKQPIDWASKDMELSAGTIDCIWNGFTMDNDRIDQYTWSDPYMDNSQVFVVSADSGIKSPAELAGMDVAVQSDSSALAALNNEENTDAIALRDSFASLTEVPDYNNAFMNLEAGAVDAVAMDVGVAHYQINQRGGGYVILDPPLASEVYAIGFKLGNTELRDQVQKTLDEMYADGAVGKVAEKYADMGIVADAITLGK